MIPEPRLPITMSRAFSFSAASHIFTPGLPSSTLNFTRNCKRESITVVRTIFNRVTKNQNQSDHSSQSQTTQIISRPIETPSKQMWLTPRAGKHVRARCYLWLDEKVARPLLSQSRSVLMKNQLLFNTQMKYALHHWRNRNYYWIPCNSSC